MIGSDTLLTAREMLDAKPAAPDAGRARTHIAGALEDLESRDEAAAMRTIDSALRR